MGLVILRSKKSSSWEGPRGVQWREGGAAADRRGGGGAAAAAATFWGPSTSRGRSGRRRKRGEKEEDEEDEDEIEERAASSIAVFLKRKKMEMRVADPVPGGRGDAAVRWAEQEQEEGAISTDRDREGGDEESGGCGFLNEDLATRK